MELGSGKEQIICTRPEEKGGNKGLFAGTIEANRTENAARVNDRKVTDWGKQW